MSENEPGPADSGDDWPQLSRSRRHLPLRERVIVWAVAALTVLAPLALGGVHATSQVALSALALALFCATVAVRGARGVRLPIFTGAATLALGFTLLQLVPLPAPLVALLSPAAYELRRGVSSAFLMPLSVDTAATWLALARGIGCTALLFVVSGFMRSRRQARLLLGAVAVAAALVALTALVQRALGATAIFGLYHPVGAPGFGFYGTFVDVNHTASMLMLGAIIGAGLAIEARAARRWFFAGAAAVSTVALLFAVSRAGLAAFGLGGFLLALLLLSRSIGAARALVSAMVLCTVGVAAVVWTSEGLRHRLLVESVVANQKTRGWVAGMRMAAAYPLTGVGRGAFAEQIEAYRHDAEGVRLVYPENLVVQSASEWGFVVTLALLALLFLPMRRLARALPAAAPSVAAGACAVVAVAAHEMADFGLEMSGLAFPTMVTLAVVAGRLGHDEAARLPRRVRVLPRASLPLFGVSALLLVGAALASRHTVDADWTHLRAAVAAHASVDGELERAIRRHPADDYLELLAAESSLRLGRQDAIHHLNRALVLEPHNWQAHRLAARLLAGLKRPSQAAIEFRLAIENGMTLEPNELSRVLGDRVLEAVPQTPPRLMELARALYGVGQRKLADAAAARAVDLSDARVPPLFERVELALEREAKEQMKPAAEALLAESDSVDSVALAARALSHAGAQKESDAAIDAGLKAHRNDATLVLVGAELRLAAGDLAGARAMLSRAGRGTLTLAERARAEELLAEAAERAGDVELAKIARARARLIAKQRQDMSFHP